MNRSRHLSSLYAGLTWLLVVLMAEPHANVLGQPASPYLRALEVLLTPVAVPQFAPPPPSPALDTNLLLNLARTPITLTNGSQLLALSFFSDSNHNYVVEFRNEIGPDLCNNWQPLTNAPHNYGIVFTEANITNRFYRLRRIDVPRSPLFALLANDTGTNSLDGLTSDPSIMGMALKFPAGTTLQASLDQPTGPFVIITNLGAPRHFVITREHLHMIQDAPLRDGAHTLHLRAENAGQTLAAFDLPFTLDTAPPVVNVVLAPGFDSPPLADGRTVVNPVTLVGQTEPGARVELLSPIPSLSAGGEGRGEVVPIYSITPDTNGVFTLTNVVLAQGTNQFFFRALDAACNETNLTTQVCWYGSECSFPDTLDGWQVFAAQPATLVPQPVAGSVIPSPDKSCAAILREGDSLLVTLSRDLLIPTLPATLNITYSQLSFDTTATNRIRDAFEIALVDNAGLPLTFTIQGSNQVASATQSERPALPPNPDACFNHTEGRTPFLAPGVALSTRDPQQSTVSIDVRLLAPGSTVRLILRLVNNDRDRATEIHINNVGFKALDPMLDFAGTPGTAFSAISRQSAFGPGPNVSSRLIVPALNSTRQSGVALVLSPIGAATNAPPSFRIATNITVNSDFVVEVFASNIRGACALAYPPAGSIYGQNLYVTTDPTPVRNCSGQPSEVYRIAPDGVATRITLFNGSWLEASPWFADFPPLGSAYGDYLYISANDMDGNPCAGFDGGGTIVRVLPSGNWVNFTPISKYAGGPTQPTGIVFTYGTPFGDRLLNGNSTVPPGTINQIDLLGATTPYFDPFQNFDASRNFGAFSQLTMGKGPWENLLLFRSASSNFIAGVRADLTATNLFPKPGYGFIASASRTFGTNVYVSVSTAGSRGGIVRIAPDGREEAFADGFGNFYAGWFGITMLDNLEFTPDGNTLFVSDWQANRIYRIRPKIIPADLTLTLNSLPPSARVGSVVAVSGSATYTGGATGRGQIVRVTINGQSVEALDSAGNFFSTVRIGPGRNDFTIEAQDSLGANVFTETGIEGIASGGAADFSNLGVVSASVRGEYGRTSFNEKTRILYADLALRNAGSYPIQAPLYVAVAHISDPSVRLLEADGLSPDGIPYYDFSATLNTDSLNTGSLSAPRTLAFSNPNKVQFTYDLVVLGQLNQAPYFTTTPTLETIAGRTYAYDANASDPDGDTLSYRLIDFPAGMTVDPASGALSWTATNGVGSYDVRLSANDGRGGQAEQHYLLNVINPPSNRPPYFLSTPVTVVRSSINMTNPQSKFTNGQIFVASSTYARQVRVYDSETLKFIRAFSHDLFTNSDTWDPRGMAFNERGNLVCAAYAYFVEFSDYGIEFARYPKLTPEGTENIIFDQIGNLYTTTSTGGSERLNQYRSPNYQFAQTIQLPASARSLTGITFDGRRRLYVGSQADQRIHVLQADASFTSFSHIYSFAAPTGGYGVEGIQFNQTGELVAAGGDITRYNAETGQVFGVFDAPSDLFPVPLTVDQRGRIFTADFEDGGGTRQADLIRFSPDGTSFVGTNDPNLFGPFGLAISGTVLPGGPRLTSYVYNADALDPDDDLLTYSLLQGPAGMTIDQRTGRITWSPSAETPLYRLSFDEPGLNAGYGECITALVPKGTVVSNQFAKLGVLFSNNAQGVNYVSTTNVTGGPPGPYGGNLLAVNTCPNGASPPTTLTAVFVDPFTGAPAAVDATKLSFFVADSNSETLPRIIVRTFDSANSLLEEQTLIEEIETMTFTRGRVARVEFIDNGGDGFTLDDFIFPQIRPQAVPVTVAAYDGRGGSAIQSFNVCVLPAEGNRPPMIVTHPIESIAAGGAYCYDVDALDPDNDVLTYSLTQSPLTMTIDQTTGLISWDPSQLVSNGARLGFQTFFGEDLNLLQVPEIDNPPRLTTRPRSDAARAAFVERLQGVRTEDFETFPDGSTPTMLHFGSDTATISGNPTNKTLAVGTYAGTFPTSGSNYLYHLGLDGSFQITFSSPQAAFGFYATDLGDGGAQLSLTIHRADGTSTNVVVPHTVTNVINPPPISGSAVYFGVIDSNNPFTSVTFTNSTSTANLFGFDEMTIGRIENVRPSRVQVGVRASDGRGGFDEQRFELAAFPHGSGTLRGSVRESKDVELVASITADNMYGLYHGRGDGSGLTYVGGTELNGCLYDWSCPETFRFTLPAGEHLYILAWDTREYQMWMGQFLFTNGLALYSNLAEWEFSIGRGPNPGFGGVPSLPQVVSEISTSTWSTPGASAPQGVFPWGTIHGIGPAAQFIWHDSLGFNSTSDSSYAIFRNRTGPTVGLSNFVVFLDLNRNGFRESCEPVAQTDSQGAYAFTNLPPGSYTLRVEPVEGWLQTDPPNHYFEVTLTNPQTVADLNFTVVMRTPASGNTSPAFVSTPAAASTPVGGLFVYAASAVDADGDALAFDFVEHPPGMLVETNTGVVVWRPRHDQLDVHDVILRVQDGRGGVALQSFQIAVLSPNSPPVITSFPPGPAVVDLPYRYIIRAQDADGQLISLRLGGNTPAGITLTNLPGVANGIQNLLTSVATAVLDWTPALTNLGTNRIEIIARDSEGAESRQTFDLEVVASAANRPPAFTTHPRTQARIGLPWTYVAQANDADGDRLSFQLVSGPTGMMLTNPLPAVPNAQGLAWTPTALVPASVTLAVSDGRPGGTVQQQFTINVGSSLSNSAPEINSSPPLAATAGLRYEYDLAADDFDGDSITWRLVNAPVGMSIDPESGKLIWVPTLDQLGPNSITVEASDIFLASTAQTWEIEVGCVNRSPQISSVPPVTVSAGQIYLYGPRASDPDGDQLSWSLVDTNVAPGLTIDATNGLVRWLPDTNQVGSHLVQVRVSDGRGGVDIQAYTLWVNNERANRAPAVLSSPLRLATVGRPYSYTFSATDADGDALTLQSLLTLPTGATFSPSPGGEGRGEGLLAWTPTASQLGPHDFILVAKDPSLASAAQRFSVTVRSNQPPVITSAAPTNALPGSTYRYDVGAIDPEGDPLTYALSAPVPFGLTMDTLGRIAWMPSRAQIGIYSITLSVSDSFGATATQTFLLHVTADTVPPQVALDIITGNSAWLGEEVSLEVGAAVRFRIRSGDNVGVTERALTVGTMSLGVSAAGEAFQTFTSPFLGNVTASVRDAAGNTNSVTRRLRIYDPAAQNQLTIQIHSPTNDATLMKSVPVVASITNPVALTSYTVEFAPAGDIDLSNIAQPNAAFTTLTNATLPPGTMSLDQATLAAFDPMVLLNDTYAVRVSAVDINGNSAYEYVLVNVQGDLKFGEFRLEFTDLSVPVAGIPITVSRVYDSRLAKRQGDFGYGWNLGVQDARIRATLKEGTLYVGSRIHINAPDGRRIGFTAGYDLVSAFGGFVLVNVRLQPDPGVFEKLEIVGNQQWLSGSGLFLGGLLDENFVPTTYRLTTKDNLVYEYDRDRGLKQVTDLNGNRLIFTAQGIQHVLAGTGAVDQQIRFERDPQGRITRVIDPAGQSLAYTYDARGDLRSFADQATNVTRYLYSTARAHFLTNIIDALGREALRMEYDESGRLTSLTDANGNPIRQDLLDPNTIKFTDANGNAQITQLDDRGNEIVRVVEGVSTNHFAYDANNNLLASTNGLGFSTNYTYDTRGNVTSITDPLNHRTAIAYNEQNKPVAVTNALGQTLHLAYNSSGQLTQVVNNAGFKTSVTRDTQGRVSSLTDATGTNTTVFDYSNGCACGRPGKVINPDGSFRLYEYNSQGLTNRIVNELGAETLFHHDAAGRLLWMRDPLTNYTQFFYNGPLLTNVVDALGRSTRYEYDNLNRTNKIIDAEGGVVEFRYDRNGNRTHVIDAVTNVTEFVYDAANRVKLQIDPLGHTNFFAYDAAGNRTEAIDRNGRKRTFRYDAANRMTNELWWEGTNVVRSIVFGFNELGVQTLAADPAARYTYSYDALNRLERVLSQSAGVPDFTLLYTYTALGQIASVTDNWGVRVGSGYDNRNRLASRTWSSTLPGAGVDPARVDFAYDVSGNRLRTDRFADLAGTNRIGFTTNAYSRAGIVTNITHLGPASQVLAKYDYHFDAAYQITRWSIGNQLSDFGYDRTGQLTNALNTAQPNENFRFDANGNRVGAQSGGEYVVGRNNQILSDGTNSYAYDFEGNMTSRSNTVTGVVTLYQFDHRNRLVSVLDRNPGGVVTQTVAFVYDAMNRRLAKTVNGQTTRFLYNQDDSWADLDGTNAVTARYLHGARIDELLARQRASDGRGWYLTDHLGTVRDIANTAGAVVAHVDYSSFGVVLGVSNPAAVDRFLFTGRELDSEVGLIFSRARYYSINLGRFISNDPIGFTSGEINLYRYVHNSPLLSADPSGLFETLSYRVTLQLTTVFALNVLARKVLVRYIVAALVAGVVDAQIEKILCGEGPNLQEFFEGLSISKTIDFFVKREVLNFIVNVLFGPCEAH